MWALLGVGIPSRIIWAGFLILISWLASPCKAQVATTFIVSSDTGSFKKKKQCHLTKLGILTVSSLTSITWKRRRRKEKLERCAWKRKRQRQQRRRAGTFEITALV